MAIAVAAVAAPACADDVYADEEEFNPWEGIEEDGRIPKIELPEDLPNPERWRYIPPGRIKPGNVFQRLMVTSFIAPFVFRDADIGWGFGLALTDIDFRKQRRQEFLGAFLSYTTKGQQNYNLVWARWLEQINLEDGGVLQEERNFVNARAGWSKTLTRRFFGLGPDSQESDETRYTDRRGVMDIGVQRTWPEPGSDLIWKLSVQGDLHDLSDGVGVEPNTADVYPILFGEAEHTDLGWFEASLAWDTRDSPVNPYRGWELGASVSAALLQTDWKTGAFFQVWSSYVIPIPSLFHRGGDEGEENPPTDVLAFKARIDQVAGDLPFFALPALGGSEDLRGFIDGRFRDRAAWITGIEWRIWAIPRGFRIPFTKAVRIERLGFAPFFEAGTVAHDVTEFGGAKVHLSYGVALLFTLERSAPFRFVFGWSDDGSNISAGFGLTF